MSKRDMFLLHCHEVVLFCVNHGGECFESWPKETLLLYVAFHAMTGGLFLRRRNGVVVGVGFAWPEISKIAMSRARDGKSIFNWSLPKQPDCVLVGEVIADKETCALFLEKAKRQWPGIRRMFTFRQKSELRLVEIKPERLLRYYGRWKLLKGTN